MTPNLPTAALPILGPEPTPDGWGGVPWMHGVTHPERLQGLRDGSVTTFPYAPGRPVLAVTDGENDLDGPPDTARGWKIDPCGEAQTALRDLHGASCDSRQFRGIVISPALEKLGVKLGDFCLVVWNGAAHWAQVYDIGPLRKQGEFSLYLARLLGLVPRGWSDHKAAVCGHDAEDVCSLIFPGSGPGHALPEDAICAGARACWDKFTSRQGTAAAGGGGKPPPATPAPHATAAWTGTAVTLALGAMTCVLPILMRMRVLAVTPPLEIAAWLGCLAFVLSLVNTALSVREKHKPNPALDQQFVPRAELKGRFDLIQKELDAHNGEITKLRKEGDGRHTDNIKHLDKLEQKLDRNRDEIGKSHESLRKDVRHDFDNALGKLDLKAEERYEKQIDRFTEIIRDLGRQEGRSQPHGGPRA